jgi:hypothetical protein
MLFGETVAVHCENHTEHTDTLCGQNAEFWYIKGDGMYSYHCGLNVKLIKTHEYNLASTEVLN